MEEEGLINFKALRAKFQEDALLAQSKTSRPAVAEKPKRLPPPGGHCISVVSGVNTAVENKAPVCPRLIFRDGLRTSGGKRPISFPPHPQQTSPSSQLANRDSTTRQPYEEQHMPLVLPVLPAKEQKTKQPIKKEHKLESEQGKEVPPLSKIKKKGLLLPFKSAKASKVSAENGEEPTYADLTTRPSSAPCELPSVEKQTTEDWVSLPSDQSSVEFYLSSPDIPINSPSAERSFDSDNKIVSTLERAKKTFSRRQMLIKPKSLCLADYVSKDKAYPSPPKNIESVKHELPIPPPLSFPHLACISARPFFKANNSAHKSALNKQLGRDKAQLPSVNNGELHRTSAPPKKPLPDMRTLGQLPPKPLRPPLVDLTCYHLPAVNKFPEPAVPEQWSQSDERIIDPLSSSQADETDPGAAETCSAAEETDNSNHALNDGIQPHPSICQQDSYNEGCDNVYEDVENINKLILGQISRKRKSGLKNPYADKHPMKEEVCLNIWPRNPWYVILFQTYRSYVLSLTLFFFG